MNDSPQTESPTQVPEDSKTAFSEACRLYQSFIDLKQKIWTLFAAASVGLATYYWASISYSNSTVGLVQKLGIRFLGCMICFLAAGAVLRVQQFIDHYESKMAEHARKLGLGNFAERDHHGNEPVNPQVIAQEIRRIGLWFVKLELIICGCTVAGWCTFGWR
jgi:hypothetical protein